MKIRTQAWDGSDPVGLAAQLREAAPEPDGLAAAVAETISRVASEGDAAVAELSKRFDGVAADPLEVSADSIAAAPAEIRSHCGRRSRRAPRTCVPSPRASSPARPR